MSCVRRICARWAARLERVIFGCDQEWLPTTMPAARSFAHDAGRLLDVACRSRRTSRATCSDRSSRRIGSVYGPGPSSKVSATRPLRTGGAMRSTFFPRTREDGPVAADRERQRDGARSRPQRAQGARRPAPCRSRARRRSARRREASVAAARPCSTRAVDRDGADREHRRRDREQPPARIDGHPAPSGVVRRAARAAGTRCEASSKPA